MTKTLPTRPSQGLSRWFGDPITSFRDEMDDLFARFTGVPGENGNGSLIKGDFAPAVDLSETDDELQIKMDVPGMKSDELDIEIVDDVLRVSGEHSEEKEEKGRQFHRIERRSGSFARSLRLPTSVKEDEVKAEYKDGVLTVSAPKAAPAKTRKIPIKG